MFLIMASVNQVTEASEKEWERERVLDMDPGEKLRMRTGLA